MYNYGTNTIHHRNNRGIRHPRMGVQAGSKIVLMLPTWEVDMYIHLRQNVLTYKRYLLAYVNIYSYFCKKNQRDRAH